MAHAYRLSISQPLARSSRKARTMAYLIHETTVILGQPFLPGTLLDGGQTREQVERAILRLGFKLPCPRLPRYGRAIIVCDPGRDPYMIRHI
jgi:hypothetical protein